MKEFSASILEPFGLRAKRVTRAYGAFICDTNQGIVLVKEANEPEEVLWFAHGAKEHLARKGFWCTDRYQLNCNEKILGEQSGEVYTVRSWMRSEEAKLTDQDCALRMAAMLGRMHGAARGYDAPTQSRRINRCHDWPQ
jgi:spore coat protein I